MRIVHVANWYIPGMGYQENCLPAAQMQLGHEVAIVTSDRLPQLPGYEGHLGRMFKDRVVGHGVFSDRNVPIHRLRCIESPQIVLLGLGRTLRQLKPDVIHAHGSLEFSTFLSTAYADLLGADVYVDDHSHEANIGVPSGLGVLYTRAARRFYKLHSTRVRCFLPITTSAKNILKRNLHVPEEKIELLPLGADTHLFRRSPDLRAARRAALGVKDGEILVMTTGKFDASKAIHVLIDAFSRFYSRHGAARLLLIGGGAESYLDELHELVARFGMSEAVSFSNLVPNDDLPAYYNAADIGVWPGTATITVLEAAAAGLSLVVPAGESAYNELLVARGASDFRAGDARSLADVLMRLSDSETVRTAVARAGEQLVRERFSWDCIAKKSLSIYSSMAGRGDA